MTFRQVFDLFVEDGMSREEAFLTTLLVLANG